MDFDKLELSSETIRELTGDELTHVAGGAARPDLLETVTCPPTRGDTFSPCQPFPTTNCG
jgi:hypothetical protein